MANVTIAPDADTEIIGNWAPNTGATYYAVLDEASADDSDFILSGATPNQDRIKIRLSDPASAMNDPMTVAVRLKATSGTINIAIRLVENNTTIAEWLEEGIATTWTTVTHELSAGERASISDFTDLYVELEANPSADSTLLAGETDGMAVDFTVASVEVQTRASSVDTFTNPQTFFTNAGTSPKYVKSATGIAWAPHNLFVNSSTPANQSVTLKTGYIYTVNVTGTGSLAGSSGASGTASAGSPATFTASGTTGTFTITGSLTTMQINCGSAVTEYLATGAAAVIGLPVSYGEGLLVEPAATNLVLQSQNLAASWTIGPYVEKSVDATTAPDGSTTADLIYLTQSHATDAQGYIQQQVTSSSGSTYTASTYVKASTWQWIALSIYDTAHHWAWFDLTNGVVGTVSGVTATITAVGDSWYRITSTRVTNGSNVYFNLLLVDADNSTAGTASGTNGVFVWGSQAELGTVATSYIPTVAGTVTRAADAVKVATSSIGWVDATGSVVAWVVPRIANNAAASRLIDFSDAATGNEVVSVCFVTADTPDSYGLDIIDGGAAQVASGTTKTGSVSVAENKVAAAWQGNSAGIVVGGGAEVTDTSCTMPTPTSLSLGYSQVTAARELNGLIERVIYVPRRMTEAQMQTKTS